MTASGLVGRDDVLADLRRALDEGTRTAVLLGMAGAGKTAVVESVVREARLAGRQVLRATGYASDQALPFGVLVDLLTASASGEHVLRRLVAGTDQPEPPDALRLRVDALEWLERLSEARPMVVIDDAHWCDDSSLSVLGFAARRLAHAHVSFLVSARGDDPPPSFVGHPTVVLPPLRAQDAAELLDRAAPDLTSGVRGQVLEQAAGNPLALLELGRAAADGTGRDAPSSVEGSFRAQVSALPDAARRVLLLCAAADGDLGAIGRLVDEPDLVDALRPAEASGLVRVAGGEVRFRHPLARTAAYASAGLDERLEAHARLAAAYADVPERRTWHRAQATLNPDEEVAAEIEQVAGQMQLRGATAEAVRLLGRAVKLTPTVVEQERRLQQVADLSNLQGDFRRTLEVTAVLAENDDPSVRLTAARHEGYALGQLGQHRAAWTTLLGVVEGLVEVDPVGGWALLTNMSVIAYRSGRSTAVLASWLDRYDQLPAGSYGPMATFVDGSRAVLQAEIAPHSPTPDLVALVRDGTAVGQPVRLEAATEMCFGAAAMLVGETTVAVDRLARSAAIMQRTGSTGQITQVLQGLAEAHFDAGSYDEAEQASRLLGDFAESRGQRHASIEAVEIRSRVAGIRGELDAARDLCDQVLHRSRLDEPVALEANVRLTMSRVHLAEQDAGRAWEELRWLFLESGEPRHVHLSYRELGHCISTAMRAGAAADVAPVMAVAERRLAGARPRFRVQLAWARALLEGDDAEPSFRAATVEGVAEEWPFELGCARLDYGGWLRRHQRHRESRAQLGAALQIFERLRTSALAELARAELRAAGVTTAAPTPSAWAGLTSQERQIARMAASGLTNREIAASLYLSPRTVSTHLYNAFPKLGVSARAQLRDAVAAAEPTV